MPEPVAEWRFDSNWEDNSGWDQKLEPVNSQPFVKGKIGRAAIFNDSSYAYANSTNMHLLSFSRGFAISGWVKWNKNNSLQTILQKGTGTNLNYALHITDYGALRFIAGETTIETYTNTVETNVWVHFGLVFRS